MRHGTVGDLRVAFAIVVERVSTVGRLHRHLPSTSGKVVGEVSIRVVKETLVRILWAAFVPLLRDSPVLVFRPTFVRTGWAQELCLLLSWRSRVLPPETRRISRAEMAPRGREVCRGNPGPGKALGRRGRQAPEWHASRSRAKMVRGFLGSRQHLPEDSAVRGSMAVLSSVRVNGLGAAAGSSPCPTYVSGWQHALLYYRASWTPLALYDSRGKAF
jgi:hypothetical protein